MTACKTCGTDFFAQLDGKAFEPCSKCVGQHQLRRKAALLTVLLTLLGPVFAWIGYHNDAWVQTHEAEREISDLYDDAMFQNDFGLSSQTINRLLSWKQYDRLRGMRDDTIVLKGNELVWFSPNEKYSIALLRNGETRWMVNGDRQ